MKTIPFAALTTLAIILFSCGPSETSGYGYVEEYFEDEYDQETAELMAIRAMEEAAGSRHTYSRHTPQTPRSTRKHSARGGQLKYFPLHHPQYSMPTRFVPLPPHWEVGQFWTTPTGTKAGDLTGGRLDSRISSVEQVIDQVFLPQVQGKIRVIGMENLPQIARADKAEQEGYYSYMPTQTHTEARGIEFVENDTGHRGYCIVHLLIKTSQAGRYASYWVSNLTNSGSTFEEDKNAFIYALANVQINPRFLEVYNHQQAGQLAANDAAFQRKMAARWQSFNSAMATSRTNSDISDIYQETWKNTSGMNDRGHASAIDGVHERNAMVNPFTGQTTHTEAGYKYYYVNQFGEYFGTNDEFYNPERDPAVNNQQWRRMEYRRNN